MIKYYKINEDNSINNGNFNDYFIEGKYETPLDQDIVNQFKYPVYNPSSPICVSNENNIGNDDYEVSGIYMGSIDGEYKIKVTTEDLYGVGEISIYFNEVLIKSIISENNIKFEIEKGLFFKLFNSNPESILNLNDEWTITVSCQVIENTTLLNESKWKKYRENIEFLFNSTSWIFERYQKEKLSYDNGWSINEPSNTIEQIRDWGLLNDLWRKRHSNEDENFDINNYTLEDINNFFNSDLYGNSTDFTIFITNILSGNLENLF